MKTKNILLKIPYSIFKWVTKTRLRKILSLTLALLVLLTSFKFLFLDPKEVKAADVYLGFNEGYGSSANDTNSTVSAGDIVDAVWKTEDLCKVGKCLYFDGDVDYVSLADNSNLDMGDGETVTVEGWFRTGDITSGSRTLIAKYDSTDGAPDDGGYIIYMNSSGQLVFATDTDNLSFPLDSITSTQAFDNNKWHFFTAVKNGNSSLTFYVDAVNVGSVTLPSTDDASNNDDLYIGYDSTSTYGGWVGFIDEVKVLRTARTAAQVKADFTGETPSRGTSASFGGGSQSFLSDSLVGYWKMDETSWTVDCSTSTVNDSSGQVEHGWSCPNTTGPAGGGVGKFGNGGVFDGSNDYIDLNSFNYFDGATKITFAAWIRPDFISTESADRPIWGVANTLVRFLSTQDDFRGTLNTASGTLNLTTTGLSWTQNTWHHIALTYDGTRGNLYWDGEIMATGTASGILENSGTDDYIGQYLNTTYWLGSIDEVRAYTRALTPTEVQALYNWAPGPVGYWKLDENTSTAANDSSGNGNTATLTNTPTWTMGKYGSGVSFAGSDQHITRADDADFDFADDADATWETWFKHGTASAQEIILSKYQEAGYKIIMESDGDITCALDYDSTWTPTDSATSTAATYDDGNWHHIACVKLGASSLTLYIDGMPIISDSSLTATNTLTNADPIYFGIDADGTSNDFTGSLDDIKIYNYARTSAQIIEDMNAGHPAPGSPFTSEILHLRFDEPYSATCLDGTSEFCDSTPYANSFNCNGCQTAQEYVGSTNTGKFGRAFDGNGTRNGSRIDDDDFDFSSTDDFSISLWYRADNATNPSTTEYLFAKGISSANRGWGIYANNSDQLCFGLEDTADSAIDVASCTSTDFYDTSWHHLVAVRDVSLTDKIYIYIDGLLRDSDTDTTSTSMANGSGIYITDLEGTNNGNEFTGDIDELQVFRSALTADQVKLSFNQAKSSVMGAISSESTAGAGDQFSFFRTYCIPGDSSTCTVPVMHLAFDDNTGINVRDVSNNSNNATMLNSAYYWKPGKIGQALEFSNVTGIIGQVLDANELDVTTAYTFEVWIYPHSLSANYNSLFYKGASMYWAIKDATNKNIEVYNGSSYLSSNNAITLDTWQHVAVTYDGSTLKYYINGVQDSTTHSSVSFSANTTNVFVGNNNTGTRPFDGLMDDFRIYGYARTPAQIMWDYNQGGPVGWWKFDESSWTNNCSTDSAYDSSEKANNGDSCPNTTGQTTPESGKRNTAIHFDDSDDYISVADAASLDLTSGVSISAWVNTDANEADNVIVSKGTSYEMGIDASGNLYWYNGSTTENDGSAKVLTGTWHHVVVTNNDTTATYYVDGVQTGTDAIGIGADNATALYIGYDGTNYFDGLVDEVKVFNYTLTAQQVKDEYNQGALRFGPEAGSP